MVTPSCVVVIAAPPGLRSVLGALADWSAAGLLTPFIWADGADAAGLGLSVEDGVLIGAQVSRMVMDRQASAGGVERVRLAVLVPAVGDVKPMSAQVEVAFAEQIAAASGLAPLSRLRVIATAGALTVDAASIDRDGWNNVIVSPEESPQQPGGWMPLPATGGLDAAVPLVASSLATLCGLWRGVPKAPLDDAGVSNSGDSKLFRAHVRWVDGSRSEARLQQAVLAPPGGNPRPSGEGLKPVYIPDAALAAGDFAKRLMDGHRQSFFTARVPVESENVRGIGKLEAIKMFFSFLVSTINPTAWVRARLRAIDEGINNKITRTLFGTDSKFAVKSKGSLAERLENLEDLSQRISDGRAVSFEAAPVFPDLWKDFMGGALTLVDGGEHGDLLLPVEVGGQPGVVHRVEECAPDRDFEPQPGLGLPDRLSRIAPADAMSQDELSDIVRDMAAKNPGVSAQAAAEGARLQEWQNQVSASYTARFGRNLADWAGKLAQEIQNYVARLAPSAQFDENRYASRLRKLSRTLRILLIVALVLIVAAVVVGVLGVVVWAIAGTIIGVVFVAWAVGSVIAFIKGQRDLFAELNRRKQLVSEQEALSANLQAASRDLRNTLEAYGQYQQWAAVATTFVQAPFGRMESADEHSDQLIDGFPDNVQVRELSLPDEEVDRIAALLQRSFYHVGWLSSPWQAVLDDLPRRLGPALFDAQAEPDEIFSQRGGADSVLTVWAQRLRDGGVGNAAAEVAWARIAGDLMANRDGWDVFAHAEVVGVTGEHKPAAGFSQAIGAAVPGSAFDNRILTPAGRAQQGLGSPAGSPWVQDTAEVLSRIVVRSESGSGISKEYLDAAAPKNSGGAPSVSGSSETSIW